MDEDQIKGAATSIGGKVKEAVGGLIGDHQTRAEGVADQASGEMQKAYGSAKGAARDAVETLNHQVGGALKQRPVVSLLLAAGVGFALGRLINR